MRNNDKIKKLKREKVWNLLSGNHLLFNSFKINTTNSNLNNNNNKNKSLDDQKEIPNLKDSFQTLPLCKENSAKSQKKEKSKTKIKVKTKITNRKLKSENQKRKEKENNKLYEQLIRDGPSRNIRKVIPEFLENDDILFDRNFIEYNFKIFDKEQKKFFTNKHMNKLFQNLFKNDKNFLIKRALLEQNLNNNNIGVIKSKENNFFNYYNPFSTISGSFHFKRNKKFNKNKNNNLFLKAFNNNHNNSLDKNYNNNNYISNELISTNNSNKNLLLSNSVQRKTKSKNITSEQNQNKLRSTLYNWTEINDKLDNQKMRTQKKLKEDNDNDIINSYFIRENDGNDFDYKYEIFRNLQKSYNFYTPNDNLNLKLKINPDEQIIKNKQQEKKFKKLFAENTNPVMQSMTSMKSFSKFQKKILKIKINDLIFYNKSNSLYGKSWRNNFDFENEIDNIYNNFNNGNNKQKVNLKNYYKTFYYKGLNNNLINNENKHNNKERINISKDKNNNTLCKNFNYIDKKGYEDNKEMIKYTNHIIRKFKFVPLCQKKSRNLSNDLVTKKISIISKDLKNKK